MVGTRKFVGLDVGGTTMKAAVVDETGQPLRAPVSLETHPERGQEAGLATMCEAIRLAVEAAGLTLEQITAIGVATPGLGDIRQGLIIDPPNLKPWKNVPVRDYVQQYFNKPTAYQNDANAAAYGEYWVGSGRGAKSMAMFTLGTGVGGGIIINGQILEGEHSHGGELGHLRIEPPHIGRLCGCGARGCLEAYASATAITRRAREELANWRKPTRLHRFLTANDEEFTARDVFDLADQGDELAQKLVDDTAYYLALGACTVIAVVDPEVIVYGGGMTAAGEPFRARIDEYIRRYGLSYPIKTVQVRFALLGAHAGFIGAAGCARQLANQLGLS